MRRYPFPPHQQWSSTPSRGDVSTSTTTTAAGNLSPSPISLHHALYHLFLIHCAPYHLLLIHCAPYHLLLIHCAPYHLLLIHCAPYHLLLIHCAPYHLLLIHSALYKWLSYPLCISSFHPSFHSFTILLHLPHLSSIHFPVNFSFLLINSPIPPFFSHPPINPPPSHPPTHQSTSLSSTHPSIHLSLTHPPTHQSTSFSPTHPSTHLPPTHPFRTHPYFSFTPLPIISPLHVRTLCTC